MRHFTRWVFLVPVLAVLLAVAGCSIGNSPPLANFSYAPSDPIARADIQFSDDSTDQGGWFSAGGVTTWNWDFGDSDSSSTQNPKHAYSRSGTYNVRLTTTDADGATASKTKTVTVGPSLDGTWRGTFDNGAVLLDMTLELNHSATGGISGVLYIAVQAYPLNAASLAGSQVTISLLNGLVLQGTLSPDERSMSGPWSFQGASGWTWMATLQN